MFVTNVPQPRINSYNFAINGRCYDPSNTKPMYDPAILTGKTGSTITGETINGDTAMGMSHFH